MLAASITPGPRRMHTSTSLQALQWISIAADAAIAGAYFALSGAMLYFARRRPDLTMRPMFWLLGAFIVAAALTHVVAIASIIWPEFRLEDGVKVATALIGVASAIAVWPMMPRALALPSTQ